MSCNCELYRRFGNKGVWFTKVNSDCPYHGYLLSLSGAKHAVTIPERIKHLEVALKKICEEFSRLKISIKQEAAANQKLHHNAVSLL